MTTTTRESTESTADRTIRESEMASNADVRKFVRNFMRQADRQATRLLEESGAFSVFNGNPDQFCGCLDTLTDKRKDTQKDDAVLDAALDGNEAARRAYGAVEDAESEWWSDRCESAYVLGIAVGKRLAATDPNRK